MNDETTSKPSWRKTKDGKWALCGPVNVMQPGAQVEVFRKDGSSSLHQLSDNPKDIGEPFENDYNPGEKMVYVYNFSEVKD